MSLRPIPEGFHSITPYLMVKNAKKVIQFLKDAFDAREMSCSTFPDGTVMHAQLKIGDSILMLSDATEKHPATPCILYHYVSDVDAAYQKAIKAGGISIREPKNEFYGDRSCGVKDPSGNQWWIASHVEDVSPEEMAKREAQWTQENKK